MVIKIFQSNLNLVWNMRLALAKSIFFFPNQTGTGLENCMQYLGVTFKNQSGFGLEKDTEWNVAAVQSVRGADFVCACAVQLHFIQCPFPNQIQFGLEKLHPNIAYNFPNQFQFGLERKKWFCKTHIPNQIQIGLENFDDHFQFTENSKPNSVWFGKIIDYCQHLEPWTNSSFILEISF